MYDITDQDSFVKVGQWVKELRKYLTADTPIVIAGNKCDMSNRQIPLEEAERYPVLLTWYSYARQVGSEHFSSSAKSGQGVIDIFTTLAKSIHLLC